MAQSSDTKPWERQQGESVKAFQAFAAYLDMGEERSLSRVAQQLGKSKTLIARWSSAYEWVERVAQYESYLRREAYKKAQKKADEMARRHIAIAVKMQEKAYRALGNTDPTCLEVKDMIALIKEAAKIERITRMDVEQRIKPPEDELETKNDLVDDWIDGVMQADEENH